MMETHRFSTQLRTLQKTSHKVDKNTDEQIQHLILSLQCRKDKDNAYPFKSETSLLYNMIRKKESVNKQNS